MRLQTSELVKYLDDYLERARFTDFPGAFNGLQVEGGETVKKIALAVDACQFTIEAAAGYGAEMLIVHHGLFWGEKAPITGTYYKRLKAVFDNGLAVYSSHLPLDAHVEVGNSAVLARMLDLKIESGFGLAGGIPIGVVGIGEWDRSALVEHLGNQIDCTPQLFPFGPGHCQRIGIMTGGAGSQIKEAVAAGCDTFITGEGAHHTFFDAEELGINVIYAGHYATETVGVRALGEHLKATFGLETCFIDHPTGL